MRFFKTTFGGLLLTLLGIVAVLMVREPRLFTAPNDWVIEDTYDGFRSYAALYYHVKHDSTYGHYEGMNYPYGDPTAFTDNLPLVANTVKFISKNIVDISDYSGAALNIMLLLSVILCAVFLFLSLRTMKLPVWYASLAALGISLLSPQLLRLAAHYGLAHPFVIPLVFWLSALFHQQKRWTYSFLIALALFIAGQLHFYLFALGGGFVLALLFFKTLFAFSRRAAFVNGVHLLIQVALPFLLLQWFLDDQIVDRPTRPYGFFAYRAYWESVFLPIDFQLGNLISKYITPIRTFDREGMAYIGLIPVLFFIKEIIQKIRYRILREEYHTIQPETQRFFLKSSFWAVFVMLIFSFGIPFIIPALEDWRFKLGPIGQFRSIGRFAWAFFYVFNIIAFYALYYQVQRIRKQGWRAVAYTILLGVLLTEGLVFFFQKVDMKLEPHPEQRADMQGSDNLWIDSLQLDEYQAILAVPFFHIGSENIWISPRAKNVHFPLWLSVQTGLPINASFMGRTSPGHIVNQLALLGEPYGDPTILNDLPNQKDFLVYIYKQAYQGVEGQYVNLLEGLPTIYENDKIHVLRLSIEAFRRKIADAAQRRKSNYETARLFNYDTIESTDSLRSFAYTSFDEYTATKKYRGEGAFMIQGYPEQVIYDGHLPFQATDQDYLLSLWFYARKDLHARTQLVFEEYQPGSGFVLQQRRFELYKTFQAIDGDWMLSEFPIRMQRPDTRIRLLSRNQHIGEGKIYVDELLIRKAGTEVYQNVDGQVIENNRGGSTVR